MALGRRGGNREGMNAWPGYVDALSTLLMVIIFVLLVFVLAQGFLSVALSSRDQALDRLNRQVAELAELLALERGQGEELRGNLTRLTEELRTASAARDAALGQISGLREERDRQGGERDALRAERDRLAARLADLELSASGAAARIASLEQRLAEAQSRAEAIGGGTAQTLGDLTAARRALEAERAALAQAREQLTQSQAALTQSQARAGSAEAARDQSAAQLAAAQQQLAALRAEMEALNRTVTADRATIEARLAEIARLTQQVRQLTALRDEMERRAQAALDRAGEQERARSAAEALAQAEAARRQSAEASATEATAGRRTAEAAATAAAEAQRRAEATSGEHARLAESARAQVALLTQQVTQLRAELARISALLDAEEQAGRDKEAQITQLGQRLNAALAARVEELQRYRSDFFGRLRDVLGDRPEVRIVGDRFVFQGEVLFPVGGADLSAAGQQQLRALAQILLEVSRRFPADLAWVLRVDGHADRSPLRPGARYASNWELSAARAIAVAQFLINEGLPPNRVAATAFGEYQPIDTGDAPDALARNRRIELRLTDR
ncbi:peptidoglycan -binding protein [Roseomonas sp. GC11]|uniref:peptidoglycan -binding protein n=1 Tax=Roseomonas sp. GC11 TaxID=2950546 RepID=UPI00210C6AF3|nr:peptidoglycan -binding protein [Roseomonas sp. GC11]MCQ4158374.1 peptidoglycan -binding protein [Roseomonas sp. GC11]